MADQTDAKPGYMGIIEASGVKIRCSDFNPKIKQDVLFYDHIIGLRDSVPIDMMSSKGDNSSFNSQKIIYRAGTKIVEGSFSFPFTELSANAFFYEACHGDDMDIVARYTCNSTKQFKRCKVNTYSFTASAGEIPQASVSIMGIGVGEDGDSESLYNTMEKLVTWDVTTVSGIAGHIASIDFTINNNCMPIYTAGTNVTDGSFGKLSARTIRVGMQQVTGSVTIYGDGGMSDQFIESTTPQTLVITSGPFTATLTVLFQYPERLGSVSAYVRNIPFVGVDTAIQ